MAKISIHSEVPNLTTEIEGEEARFDRLARAYWEHVYTGTSQEAGAVVESAIDLVNAWKQRGVLPEVLLPLYASDHPGVRYVASALGLQAGGNRDALVVLERLTQIPDGLESPAAKAVLRLWRFRQTATHT